MNFILEPNRKSTFAGNIDVDTIILNLSALIPDSRFINRKTCIILDEIQECKEARTALKSFHIDGCFDVIGIGSLLGVKGYNKSRKKNEEEEGQDSVPVGYETVINMYPLDFEEFLWANGISDPVIDSVKSCFENEKTVPDGILKTITELLHERIPHQCKITIATEAFVLQTPKVSTTYNLQIFNLIHRALVAT